MIRVDLGFSDRQSWLVHASSSWTTDGNSTNEIFRRATTEGKVLFSAHGVLLTLKRASVDSFEKCPLHFEKNTTLFLVSSLNKHANFFFAQKGGPIHQWSARELNVTPWLFVFLSRRNCVRLRVNDNYVCRRRKNAMISNGNFSIINSKWNKFMKPWFVSSFRTIPDIASIDL